MIHTFKKIAWSLAGSLACLLTVVVTSCDKTGHEIPEDLPQGGAAITVGIRSEAMGNTFLRDIHLYFFDASEMLCKHLYYPEMQELALDRILMNKGYTTVFAILNTEKTLTPSNVRAESPLPELSLSSFCQWVKTLEGSAYPDMATGMTRCDIKEGVSLVMIDVKKGTTAIDFTQVKLNLTYPSPRLPDFASLKGRAVTGDVPQLRAVIEVYRKGTEERVMRKETFVTPTTTEGLYTADLLLTPATYDLRIWSDYTLEAMTDNHYITNSTATSIIRLQPKGQYRGNTDTRDAFTQRKEMTVAQNEHTESVQMHRPLAKYRIVATDVRKYEEMRVKYGYPSLEDIQITVAYEGFLPNAYSVKEQKPADADTGYRYSSAVSQESDQEATVAKDYILVNGTQSFVTVSILFTDLTGKTIGGVKGVRIDYRAGQLTTLRGAFLTAGLGGFIDIDTEWGGDYEVEF